MGTVAQPAAITYTRGSRSANSWRHVWQSRARWINGWNDAAAEIARAQGYDLVINEESLFYHNPKIDISDAVVVEMNKAFDIEQKKNEATKGKTPASATLPLPVESNKSK